MPKRKQPPPTHCRQCGEPFSPERPRHPRRWICRQCFCAYERLKNHYERLLYTVGVYPRGQRVSESGDLKKITGRARLLRDRRIARYTRCVERGAPIEYEPDTDLR